MRHPYGETIGHQKYTGTGRNAHGKPVDQWDPAVLVEDVVLEPVGTDEPSSDTTSVLVRYRVLDPNNTDVRSRDRIIYEGNVYEVDGDSVQWPVNPFFGNSSGSEYSIRRAR